MTSQPATPILINGILSVPDRTFSDKARGWVPRAVAFAQSRGIIASDLQYFTTALLKTLWQGELVDRLLGLIDSRYTIRLVGHSNGADIICEALGHLLAGAVKPLPLIDEVHLIAGAVEHDFSRNNLNAALRSGLVGRVVIYASTSDYVLRWIARPSRLFLGLFGRSIARVGYGYLGYQAAADPDSLGIDPAVRHRVEIITQPYGHSGWFAPGGPFEDTMVRALYRVAPAEVRRAVAA